MKSILRALRRLWKAGTFSPEAFLARALILSVLYAISCLCGLQEYTTFLSGTSANPNLTWQTASLLGCIHLFLYVGFILLVPISLIAAGLLAAWNRWQCKQEIPDQQLAATAAPSLSPKV